MFLVLTVSSQTVVTDTLTKSLDSLTLTSTASLTVTTNGNGFDYKTTAPMVTNTVTLTRSLNVMGYDSVTVFYKFYSPAPNTVNGTFANSLMSGSPSHSGNINFLLNIHPGSSSTITIKNFYVIGYKTSTTTGIKTLNELGLNVFTYGSSIKVNGFLPENFKVNIVNLSGQTVMTTTLLNELETNLPSGIYILQVIDNKGNLVENKKVVIQ